MLKIVKQYLCFSLLVAREMEGRWKGDERDKVRRELIVKRS